MTVSRTALAIVSTALLIPSVLSLTARGSTSSQESENSVTITDQRGQQVSIPQPVTQIASAVIPAPTIIAAVDDSWNRIIGINESLLQSSQEGIIGTIFPDSTRTAVVSDRAFAPNMEAIVKLLTWLICGQPQPPP